MDVHIIVKLKSSYDAWKTVFDNDADNRSQICDESKTLAGKANDTTAMVTLFDVNMDALGQMMADPEFQKLAEDFVEQHIPYSLSTLSPPS